MILKTHRWLSAIALGLLVATAHHSALAQVIPNQYIVTLQPGICGGGITTSSALTENVERAASRYPIKSKVTKIEASVFSRQLDCRAYVSNLMHSVGGAAGYVYQNVLTGFSATLSPDSVNTLRSMPNIVRIEQDLLVKQYDAGIQKSPDSASAPTPSLLQITSTGDNWYRYAASGKGVYAYVIDGGVQLHTDYKTQLRESLGFDAIGDGRGTRGCNWHGTGIAGIIAGKKTGVAKDAFIVPVRIFDCAGRGTVAGILAALDFVAVQPYRPAVINMSFGLQSPLSLVTAAAQAIDLIVAKGFVVIAAAGNEGINARNIFPASHLSVLAVGSVMPDNASWSPQSNFGDVIYAPGSTITMPFIDVGGPSVSLTEHTSFSTDSGTSFAAPHVAGIAAMILEKFPLAGPSLVIAMIKDASLKSVVRNTPLAVPLPPFGDAVNINNLWSQSFAVKSITGQAKSGGYLDPNWSPIATVEIKLSGFNANAWLGAIEIEGKFGNVPRFCQIKRLIPLESATCTIAGPLIWKGRSRTSSFEVTSINGKNVTYDRNQNAITQIFIRY